MQKISAVYKIVNTVTGEFYIGSSKDVLMRWANHKCTSRWKRYPNNLLYQDFQKYGIDKFRFQILCSIIPECLKQVEQDCIQLMKPSYNDRRANGIDVEREKEYYKSEKGKKAIRKSRNKYLNQLCLFKGEILTLNALRSRFSYAGIPHPTIEAKKYLIK